MGAPPGTPVPPTDAHGTVIRAFGYSPETFVEKEISDVGAIGELLAAWPVTWVDVDGVRDTHRLKAIAEAFHLHPLALEDVIHVHQRPKVEAYGEHLYIVLRMPCSGDEPNTEQLSIFLGRNFVLTFQEHPGDCLDGVRQRIRNRLGRVRTMAADYLAYALIDAVIDHYFPIVEGHGDKIETLDESILEAPGVDSIQRIHDLRHVLIVLRRTFAPLRDAVGMLLADESGLISPETKIYIRDCSDHVTHLVETTQLYQDMSTWHMEAALSALNLRSGEVMRVLTVIATIFIPLSFIAGVYGMNFATERSPLNMPELNWYFGYPFALALMAATAGGLLYYFRRKRWV